MRSKLTSEISNNHSDNFDHYRFNRKSTRFRHLARRAVSNGEYYNLPIVRQVMNAPPFYRFLSSYSMFNRFTYRPVFKYLDKLEYLWDSLEDQQSKELMVDVIAFRILGHRKVKLPLNTSEFWEGMKSVENCKDPGKTVERVASEIPLTQFDISRLGVDVKLYSSVEPVFTTFIERHYDHIGKVESEQGDVVLDLGGCYGDTALFFADRVGESGRVHTFEFIPSNLKVLQKNLELNPGLTPSINVVESPIWNQADQTVYYCDRGPASRVSLKEFAKANGTSKTVSIDEYARRQNLERLDFIKMDIEGAELNALKGGVESIKKFKPKLAISIYHSMDDFVDIQKYIEGLGLNYRFYFGHATIHREESVLFAKSE